MSADLTITATIITQSGKDLTPVGVQIKGTGAMPFAALHAIAEETLATYTGSNVKAHGYRVAVEPSFHEETDDTVTIFPVFRSLTARD